MLSAEIILLILIIITAKYRRQQQCPTHIIEVQREAERERREGEGVERAAKHTNFNGYARQRLVQRAATANGFH